MLGRWTESMRAWRGGIPAVAAGREVDLPGVPPFQFRTHQTLADICISDQIANHGVWEQLETEVVCRLLPLYTTFLDLGANIGWYTAIAQRLMRPGSRIFAFEPGPNNFALLKRNTASPWRPRRPKTTLIAAAVSDHVGTVELHLSPLNQGDHRIYASEAGRSCVTAAVTSLDAFFGNKPLPPVLLKSDTQGSEPRILRGARRALSESLAASVLLLEFWPHGMAASGEDIGAFIAALANMPHQPFVIDGAAAKLRPIAWSALAVRCEHDLAPATQAFVDLVLLPPGSQAYRAVEDLMAPPA